MASSSKLLCPSKEIQDVDENVWAEILKRLPVNAMGRSRCVCKSWNSLISSSFFVESVSKRLRAAGPTGLLYNTLCPSSRTVHCCMHDLDQDEPHLGCRPLPLPNIENNPKPKPSKWGPVYRPVGVVNGVVCLNVYRESGQAAECILWNPTVRRHVVAVRDVSHPWAVVGFGFDARTNAFKLVRMRCRWDGPFRLEVMSLSSTGGGGWRTVAYDVKYGVSACRACYVNGGIHWLVRSLEGIPLRFDAVLVLDCERDELRTMALPLEIVAAGRGRICRISKLFVRSRDMLSVLVKEDEMWVMEEYGVSSSWKRLQPPEDFVHVHRDLQGVHCSPDAYSFHPSLFLMDKKTDDHTLN